MRVAVDIGALGDVIDLLLAIGFHDADIGVWVAHVGNQGNHEPLSVGTPLVCEAIVARLIVLAAVGDGTCLFCLGVIHFQDVAVLDEGDLLAVGRISRVEAFHTVIGKQRFLIDEGGVCEVIVILTLYGSLIDVPVAVAFGGIHQGTSVFGERRATFRLGGMGDLFGGGVFVGASHEHFSA